MRNADVSAQGTPKLMPYLCERVGHLQPWLVFGSCWELKWKFSGALPYFFSEHDWINCEAITAYHKSNAMHLFTVLISIESLLLMPINDTKG